MSPGRPETRFCATLVVACGLLCVGPVPTQAQELEPRAYSVSPTGVNVVVLSFGRATGDLAFDPSLPFEDVTASITTVGVGYFRTIDLLGRTASVAASLPLLDGSVQGLVAGEFAQATRTGQADPRFRFAVNLVGAPAMDLREFSEWEQGTTLGVSLAAVAPGGQYAADRLINIGSNRWSIKPELGLSNRIGRWHVDFYAGVWLFGTNDDYLGQVRRQDPLGVSEFHLSYNLRPRFWVAFDANFYTGGRTEVDGVDNFDFQRNSRVGGTVSVPIDQRQSLKFSVSVGALTRVGADFTNFSFGYQVLWGGGF